MKCSICARVLGTTGVVLTLVTLGPRTYTATVHPDCLADLVGITARRRIDRLCIDSGWKQADLPGFLREIDALS